MTFSQQLKQQGLEQDLKEGEHRKVVAIAAIAKKLLDEGRSPGAVQKLT
ncbi:MAG: transposase [Gammaproteobacteria bacterium]|nr:MAG: transposase [Gammaproteobacteria bacterium]